MEPHIKGRKIKGRRVAPRRPLILHALYTACFTPLCGLKRLQVQVDPADSKWVSTAVRAAKVIPFYVGVLVLLR